MFVTSENSRNWQKINCTEKNWEWSRHEGETYKHISSALVKWAIKNLLQPMALDSISNRNIIGNISIWPAIINYLWSVFVLFICIDIYTNKYFMLTLRSNSIEISKRKCETSSIINENRFEIQVGNRGKMQIEEKKVFQAISVESFYSRLSFLSLQKTWFFYSYFAHSRSIIPFLRFSLHSSSIKLSQLFHLTLQKILFILVSKLPPLKF